MPKLSHRTLIAICGCTWLAIGGYLLSLGLHFIVDAAHAETLNNFVLLRGLASLCGGADYAAVILIAVALCVGHLKGRFVLAKSVKRVVNRILSFPDPTSLGNIYAKSFYILIAVMMGLGMAMKIFGLASDIRGFVDVIVGAALLQGAVAYFRCAAAKKATCGSACL